MGKRFLLCAIVIAAFALLGLLAYNFLEIHDQKKYVPPGREAMANSFLAMDRWLKQTGHPLRIEKQGSPGFIAAASGKAVMVQAAACGWKDAGKVILPWIESGGSLFIWMEHSFYDKNLADMLISLGIRANNFPEDDDYDEGDYEADEDDGDKFEPAAPVAQLPAVTGPVPDFDNAVEFFVDETAAGAAADVAVMRSKGGQIRLVQVSCGAGTLTVSGRPLFMYNRNLDNELNARLAWELTAAKTSAKNPELFVIRSKRITKGLFGKLADRGNIASAAISAAIVIFLGFWMVIPVFGPVFYEKPRSARPIRERFLAEVRFLKKYDALNYYIETYERELKLKHENSPRSYRDKIKLLKKMSERV